MTYTEQVNKEIEDHFNEASNLNKLIEKNIEQIALNVCNQKGSDVEYLNNAKIGCYMAWVERLCTLLPDKEIQRLTKNLEGKDA